jgi:hypothetical protein
VLQHAQIFGSAPSLPSPELLQAALLALLGLQLRPSLKSLCGSAAVVQTPAPQQACHVQT